MVTGYFIIIFSKNSVFSAEHIDITKKEFTKNIHYLDDAVPPGEYVVITCDVGRPETLKIGLTKIEYRNVTVIKSIQLRDLYYVHEEVPVNTMVTLMPYNDNTKILYADTIKIIREKGFGPWWDNAPREVKAVLEVTHTNEHLSKRNQNQVNVTSNDLSASKKMEIDALFSSDQSTIESAVASLVQRGEKAATEISYLTTGFIKRLGDQDYRIRGTAAHGLKSLALHEIKDMGAVEPLITALKDEEPFVRVEAAWTLQYLHDSRAVEPLIGALKDELGTVRSHAAEALGNIGDTRAVEPLIDALKKDKRMDVREVAATSLWRIKDARAIEPLIDALNDDYVRTTARVALENLTGKDFGSNIAKWPEWWEQNKKVQSQTESSAIRQDQNQSDDVKPAVAEKIGDKAKKRWQFWK